jgi:hypothetical protein
MVPKGADPSAPVERWRVILCDGVYFCQSMLGTSKIYSSKALLTNEDLSHLMTDGLLQRFSIVEVSGAQANSVHGKRQVALHSEHF